MKFRLTGISITGEWNKEDWRDFYHTLEAFEKRVAIRHGELPSSQKKIPFPKQNISCKCPEEECEPHPEYAGICIACGKPYNCLL